MKAYQRLAVNAVPLYVNPEMPDWIIPTAEADYVLQRLQNGESASALAAACSARTGLSVCSAQYAIDKIISRMNGAPPESYQGRSHYRRLKQLKECWFHITNQCNMACGHCMFSSNRGAQPSLPFGNLIEAMDEAFRLGCRIFYFTGGEPFVYHSFDAVCDHALQKEETHVVILTNGKNLQPHAPWLDRLPRDRVHVQGSIDGLEQNHNAVRGKGAFQALQEGITLLQSLGFPTTLAMAVTRHTVREMAPVVDIAHSFGIQNLHYLWLFLKGKAGCDLFVAPDAIYPELIRAYENAEKREMTIDNLEILKSQLFSLPGTRYDLSNAAWESIAVGPDGTVYPSPALVGEPGCIAGNISQGVEETWRTSPLFQRIRAATLLDDENKEVSPLKYLIGGG